ncbi:Pr6Pr family membrane protein [Nocardia crassostreae]|uniref:Pr6Pr family membrane protein n=1 Tax=Nocardia crassostreae TaxID=53428 RepID=UPI0008327712|nr:Pr6Pr family membrane protein [Nocardia crassostreae]
MNGTAEAPWWIRGLRLAFGVLGVFTLAWGPLKNLDNPAYSMANYFSYFTIQSNILAAVVLLVGGLRDPRDRRWRVFRGAATLYMVITGIIYAVLLADIDVQMQGQWTNTVLHRVIPVVMLVDWLLVPAGIGVSVGLLGAWLIYPILYGVYTLIRGPIVDWYPYPFIDPREQGYLDMALGLVVMVLVFMALAAVVARLGVLVHRYWDSRQTHYTRA